MSDGPQRVPTEAPGGGCAQAVACTNLVVPPEGDPRSGRLALLSALTAFLDPAALFGTVLAAGNRLLQSREHCCRCGAKIPPGRAGRQCEPCREPAEGHIPEGYYFRDDLDGGRLVKKDAVPHAGD